MSGGPLDIILFSMSRFSIALGVFSKTIKRQKITWRESSFKFGVLEFRTPMAPFIPVLAEG